jgi:hypothetical protein
MSLIDWILIFILQIQGKQYIYRTEKIFKPYLWHSLNCGMHSQFRPEYYYVGVSTTASYRNCGKQGRCHIYLRGAGEPPHILNLCLVLYGFYELHPLKNTHCTLCLWTFLMSRWSFAVNAPITHYISLSVFNVVSD